MDGSGLLAVSLDERPDLVGDVESLDREWPPFMREGKSVRRYWGSLNTARPDYQLALLDAGSTAVVAKAHTIPIAWDGTDAGVPDGVDAVLKHALLSPPTHPDALCALAIVVAPEHRGRGLSALVLRAVRELASRRGLRDVVAPVRPTRKALFPLTPIDRYVGWTDGRGLPLDPWLRVHVRAGGRVFGFAPRSMVVSGTVADWERWSGRHFGATGSYCVAGALGPVEIECEVDVGTYEEPNVWIHHA